MPILSFVKVIDLTVTLSTLLSDMVKVALSAIFALLPSVMERVPLLKVAIAPVPKLPALSVTVINEVGVSLEVGAVY